MAHSFDLGLILPCYNYEAGLSRSLEEISSWRDRSGLRVALCIADDGSSDRSAKVAGEFQQRNKEWCFLIAGKENRGKGHAVRMGGEALKGLAPYVFFTDADLHYGLKIISDRLLPELRAGADVVLVDRSWSRQFHASSPLRKLLSYSFMHLKAIMASMPLEDSQAGLKGFRASFFDEALSLAKIDGFAFDVEILSIAIQSRSRIRQVPILITGSREIEGSSMTPRKAARMFWDLLAIALRRYRGGYESAVFRQRISDQVYEIKENES